MSIEHTVSQISQLLIEEQLQIGGRGYCTFGRKSTELPQQRLGQLANMLQTQASSS